jgi:corrinoid protein of di/trimethylamine methyltransferase
MLHPALINLRQAIVNGDEDLANRYVKECMDIGINPRLIFDQAIIAGIQETGRLWDIGKYFVPDVILSADAFNAAVEIIERHLEGNSVNRVGKVVIGTVEGDMHDLGKNIVIALLRGAGFEVIDLGIDNPVERFIQAVISESPDILGVGAYMSTSMLEIKNVIRALVQRGLREKVKVIVGGVTTTQHFADEIGADAWGPNASAAVEEIKSLLNSTGGDDWQSDSKTRSRSSNYRIEKGESQDV